VIGWGFINPVNHTPMIPAATTYTTPEGVVHPFGGVMGILGAAGIYQLLKKDRFHHHRGRERRSA